MNEANIKADLANIGPVAQFMVFGITKGVARGYAAPTGSANPSGLLATSGERVLGVAVATGFSSEALTAGLRHGWCGFELSGVTLGAALGEIDDHTLCGDWSGVK